MPSFLFPNGSFFPNVEPTRSSPATGTTVSMPQRATELYLTPAATIAALTVKLPPNPLPGTLVSVMSSQTVTALTVQNAAGTAVAGAPTTLAPNDHIFFQYISGVWVPETDPGAGPMRTRTTTTTVTA